MEDKACSMLEAKLKMQEN